MIEFRLNHSSEIPHLEQYFGAWCMHELHFRALADRAASLDVHAHMETQANGNGSAKNGDTGFEIVKGVALIDIQGTLMKHVSSFSNGTSTILARRQIRAAANSKSVGGIILRIDSPGGTVSGTESLANEVAKAASVKPLVAFIDDLGASAAYWVASQAPTISANPSALVGSIGTFGVVHDLSAVAAREGVKVHVIRAGKFKGTGVPGTEITSEQLQESQRVIDSLNDLFVGAVSDGRGMSFDSAMELADGRVHVAQGAKSLGLIDSVQSFDEVFSKLEVKSRRFLKMANTATYKEIKAACVGADAEFIAEQLERENSLEQAQSDWMTEQCLRMEQLNQRLAEAAKAKAEAEAAAAKAKAAESIGVDALEEGKAGTDVSGDPIQQWNELIQAKLRAGLSRPRAVSSVARENPELRKEMLIAHNAAYGRKIA